MMSTLEKSDELYQEYLSERLDMILKVSEPRMNDDEFKHVIEELGISKVHDFHDGWARVEKEEEVIGWERNYIDTSFNFINEDGKLISNEWYDKACDFSLGKTLVHKSGKSYYLLDADGYLHKIDAYDSMYKGGLYEILHTKPMAIHEHNVCDINGRMVLPRDFDKIEFDSNKKGDYKRSERWLHSTHEKWIGNRKYDLPDAEYYLFYIILNDSFTTVKGRKGKVIHVVCRDDGCRNYKKERNTFGYTLTSDADEIKLKYEPIKVFNLNYILCHKMNNLYLYNRSMDKYIYIGDTRDVSYDDNFIFDKSDGSVNFIYGLKVIDVTDYYNKYIKGKQYTVVKDDVSIISRDDFLIHSLDKIHAMQDQEKQEDRKKQKEEERLAEEKRLQDIKERAEREREEKERIRAEALEQLQRSLEILGEDNGQNKKERTQISNLFIDVDDHKEINPVYLSVLRYINLSMESFKNVKIDGIDFRGCNIYLMPQKVYMKDLKNCNFEGLHIDVFMDFTGVDIRGASFSQDDDPKTYDGGNVTFKDAIYDETTTYNGIPFTEIYGECASIKKPHR